MDTSRRWLAAGSRIFVWGLSVTLLMAFCAATLTAETLMMPERHAFKGSSVIVWGTTTLSTTGATYSFNFGDNTSVSSTFSDQSYIATTHTYTAGCDCTVTLTVTSGTSTETATAVIHVYDPSADVPANVASNTRATNIDNAIQDGLRYLWLSQSNRQANFPNGITTNWETESSWKPAWTSLVTLAFENQGYNVPNDNTSPYAGVYEKYIVRRGLNYVISELTTVGLATRSNNDPVTNLAENPCVGVSDCTGFRANYKGDGQTDYSGYGTPIAMLPFAASGALSRKNEEVSQTLDANTSIHNMTYNDILQRLSNSVAWGQGLSGLARGGWHYGLNQNDTSDGSTIGWNMLALLDAGAAGITIPAFVEHEFAAYAIPNGLNLNDGTLDYNADGNSNSRGDGLNCGFNNCPPDPSLPNMVRAGVGLQGLYYTGVTGTAFSTSTAGQGALNFLATYWGGNITGDYQYTDSCLAQGDGQNKGCAYAMFNIFKGLKLQGVTTLGDGVGDWYADYQNFLVSTQTQPSSSTSTTNGGNWGNMRFSCCVAHGTDDAPPTAALSELILAPVALIQPDQGKFSTIGLTEGTTPASPTNPPVLTNEGQTWTTNTVTATALSGNNTPVPGAAVVFKVTSGPNSGLTSPAGTTTTDSNGHTAWTYTGSGGGGTDVIQAFIGTNLSSDTVRMQWDVRPLTVTATGVNKVYDATTTATVTLAGNTAPGDNLSLTINYGAASFGDKVVANGKLVNVSGISISGPDSVNYSLSNTTASTTANITARPLTVAAMAQNKPYDGTTIAFGVTLSDNRLSGDVFTDTFTAANFTDKNVGNNKGVSVTGISITGTDAGNYTYNTTAATTANVTAANLNITADPQTKVYATPDPVLTYQVSGLQSGDTAATVLSGALSRAPGEDVASYLINQGTLASVPNYTINFTGNSLTITPAASTTVEASAPNPSVYGQTVTFTATVSGPLPLPSLSGNIGHWTLDDPAGSTVALDSSGSGNNAHCGGTCPTFQVPGQYGTAASFDGSSNYLTVNNTIGGTFTASAWINTTSTGGGAVGDNAFIGNGIVWSDVGGAANDMIPMALVADRVAFGTGENNGGSYDTITSTVPVNTGNWVFVVVTRDSTTGAKQLYINGVLSASSTGSTGTLNANGIVAFGANPLDGRYFSGVIDDVQFFNRVLTPSEIQSLYGVTGNLGGTVTFADGSTTLGSSNVLATGVATFSTSALAVGSHPVTATYGGSNNYAGSNASVNQVVNQGATSITLASSLNPSNYGQSVTFTATVNGVAPAAGSPTGTVTFKDGGTTIGTGTLNGNQASFTPLTPLTAGPHSITATYGGDTDFKDPTGSVSQQVNQVNLTISADSKTKAYGAITLPALTISYSGFISGESAASLTTQPTAQTTATAASHVVAGGYPITVSGAVDPNYNITYAPGTLTVTAVDLVITANNQTKAYGATTLPTLTVSYNGLTNGDAATTTPPSVTTTATVSSHVVAAGYPITASGAVDADYNISYVAGNLTVTPVGLTITANNQMKAYAAALPMLTVSYSGLTNGDAATTTPPSVTTTATASSHVLAGGYPITASGAVDADYNISYGAGTLTITAVSLSISADNQSKAYGGPLPTLTASYNGLVNGDTPSTIPVSLSTTATAASHVIAIGYPISVSNGSDADYTIGYTSGTLTVNPVPLTINPNPASKVYGAPLPTLSATYVGVVNGDTATTTPATLTTTATATSHVVGTYTITASNAADADYSPISYGQPATLTVTPALLTISADNKTKLYGDANPALTATYTTLVNGDTASSLATLPALATSAVAGSAVGSYAITISGAVDPDYSISYSNGTLNVTPAPLTITAAMETKIYGNLDPSLAYQVTGLKVSDTVSVLTGVLIRVPGENVGSYNIGLGTLAPNGNYAITTYNPNVLTITPRALTITANNFFRDQGLPNPIFTGTITNAVPSDNVQAQYSTGATQLSPIGTYAITIKTNASTTNYAITLVPGVLTIGMGNGLYITSYQCNALTMSGNSFTDSYNSSNPGGYAASKSSSGGDIFVNGSSVLNGGVVVNGKLYTVNPTLSNNCSGTSGGVRVSGKAGATGGYTTFTPYPFETPGPYTPGSTNLNINNNQTLPPGSYGDIKVNGKTVLTLQPGTYYINSITLTGGSQVEVQGTGQVILDVAGVNNSKPIDFSGGSVSAPSGIPGNFLINYGGTGQVDLTGQADSYGVLYAPKAAVNLSGGGDWFGSMVAYTLNDSGGAAVHYDQALGAPQP